MIAELVNRAVALHQAGRLGEAEGLYRQAIAGGAGGDPQVQYLYAAALMQQNRPAEALPAVEAALRAAPHAAQILILHGAALQALGRLAEALASLSRATAVAPAVAEAWYNQGLVLSELGRPAEALVAFDRMLQLEPSAAAFANHAAVLYKLGRPQDALASVDRALGLAPNLPPALRSRSLILLDLGRTAEALEATDRLLEAAPDDVAAWGQRAALLHDQRRYDEVVGSAERALALQPGQPGVWTLRGQALADLHRYDDALSSYEQALALNPDWVGAKDGRAFTLASLGRREEAITQYEAILGAQPDRAAVWLRYGFVLGVLGRLDASLAALDRALAIDPGDLNAQLARASLLCELGRTDEGLAQIVARACQRYRAEERDEPSEAKARHDEEQRAWLAAKGVTPGAFHIEGGERICGPAVNPANRETVAEQWATQSLQLVVIDDLLTPPALDALRRFCWGSTFWRRSYRQGYLGALAENGFGAPLLAQIADELRETFPTVLGAHPLLSTWAFKYDSRLGGISAHADQAAINVNFWITPDEANLDPASGGMVVWDKAAPADWDIGRYNGDVDRIHAFLAETKAQPVTVPYRANRAVVFVSDLFHKTDDIRFREGYENRRINVTALYGRRTRYND